MYYSDNTNRHSQVVHFLISNISKPVANGSKTVMTAQTDVYSKKLKLFESGDN